MGIVRELSPELDPVEFPDSMSPEMVEAYVAEKGDELRRRLIARKQASMATETEGEEALKYAMGEVPLSERVGSTILNLPQTAMRQMGGTLRGLGAYLAEAPIPRERGEVGTGVVQENLRRRQRTPEQVAAEIEQSAIREAGTGMQEAAPEIFPTLPGVRESLPSQVSGGLGSIAALAPAMVSGPAAPFVGGAMYGLSAGEDFADDARRVVNNRIAEALANGDYDTAADLERRKFDMEDKARQAGRVIGAATEGALGVAAKLRVGKSSIGGIGEKLAERLVAKSAPQMVQRAVRGAVEGGATEAAQEATEQALGNAAALAVYDPDRSIMEGLGQAALVGGLTGGIAGGARGSDRRNPLPRSTAAAAGKRVAQEIPQDVGDIAAPDITEADVEDVFAGVPAEPTPAPVETPVEQPTAAAPVEQPATPAVEEPAPASPKKPRRKRVPIEDADAIEAAIPATPAPEPATPPQAEAPRVTIPPDDAAMEAATAAAVAPGQPTPIAGAPEEGIADPVNRIPALPTNLAEAIAAEEAPDVFVENTVRKFGEGERASAQSTKPTAAQREILAKGKAFAESKGWKWDDVKEAARRQLGLDERFLKPGSRAFEVAEMMRKEDEFAAKKKAQTEARDAEMQAQIDERKKTEEEKKRKAAEKERAEGDARVAKDKASVAKLHDDMVAKLPGTFIAKWRDAKTKKAKQQLLTNAAIATGSRNEPAITEALDRRASTSRAVEAADLAMEQATARPAETPTTPVTAPDAGIAERVAADTEMERATAQAGQTPAEAALNVAPEDGVSASGPGSIYEIDTTDGKRVAVQQGQKPGPGDPIYRTREEAIAETQKQAEIDAKNAESRARWKQEEDRRAAEEAERTSLDGFEATLTPMQRGRAVKALTKAVNYKGKPQSIRDVIRGMVSDGATVKGDRLERPDGSFLGQKTLTKMGLDYSRHLISKREPTAEPTPKQESDRLERALDAAIKATDPKSATFSDPFLIAAVGLPVLNAALRLARRVYLRTRNLVRAKQQGMRLIRRRQRTIPPADLPKIEEAFSNLVDNGITEGPPPQTVTPASPLPGGPRRASRGLFKGDVTIDSDAQWQAQADEWIAQFNGNLRRAFETARSTDFQTTGLNQSAQYYVFGKLLELSEIAANAARNDVDMLRHLRLQNEITDAMKFDAAEAGKALAATNLVKNRIMWMFPVLTYRNLIREEQKRLPFPDVVADEVRTWLSESGRRAVQEMRNVMTDADKVFARELKSTVRDMRVVWRDVMTASVESQENMRRKILEELVKAPELKGLSRQGYIDIANLLGKAWERERARIFQAEFRKQVPLPSVKEDDRRKLFTAIPNILKWANLGLLDNEAFRNAIAPQYGVAKFDGETAKKLNTMAQEAQKVGGANRKRIINEMNLFMQKAGGVRTLDVIRDYWFAAVLSGIRTHIDAGVNVLNGALMAAMGASMAKPGTRGTVAKAFGKGLSEALDDFWPILWNGEVWRNVNYNPDAKGAVTLETLSKSRNAFAKAIGQLKYVSRLTTALDHLTALSTRQAMMAWALSRRYPVEHLHRYMTPSETVLKQARARAEAEGTPKDAMNKRVREIVEEWVPVEILISAKDLAEVATYTNRPRGLAGAAYDGLQAFEKKFPGAKFLSGTMFARFAGNGINTMLNYTAPAALYRYYQSAPSRQNAPTGIRLGEEERLLLLAQMALGSTLGAFAAASFLGDDDEEKERFIDITGSFQSLEPGKKNQLLSEGRVPYSIRVGNKYYSYRQMGFGGVLGAIGELRDRQLFNREKWDQESMVRKVMDAGAAGLFIIRDSPAISSFTEFLGFANAYKYDPDEIVERSAPKFLARLAGSAIPNLVKEIDAWGDPSIFKANVGHEYFLQQVPYLRRELGAGPMLNVLGEPVQVERYPWSRWIKTRREDKAWSTLGTLASRGVFLPVPSANVKVLENGKRRPMTPQEQHAYQKRVGADYRKFVEENSDKLLRMKPEEAVEFIKKQTERIRRRND